MTVRVDGSTIDPDLTAHATAPSASWNTAGSIVPRSTVLHASALRRIGGVLVGVVAFSGTQTTTHTPTRVAQTKSKRAAERDRVNNAGIYRV